MRKFIALIGLALLLWPASHALAYESQICTSSSSTCTEDEVGVFMTGISKECGNSGTCELEDILTVIANVGNWVIGIIGGIVLLMYVIGGFYFLISGGNESRITKGKEYLKISTIGLLIVMFAYLGIYALRGAIQFGDFTAYRNSEYVACVNEETNGQPCDLNATCIDGSCVTECAQNYGDKYDYDSNTNKVYAYSCVNTEETEGETGCLANLCPGDYNWQCCKTEYILQGATYDSL